MILPRIGLGCMNLSHAYGIPPTEDEGLALLRAALDAGVRMLDIDLYYLHRWDRTATASTTRCVSPSKTSVALCPGSRPRIGG